MKKGFSLKNLWKRNQIIITALALMIAIAGYLNFNGRQATDEALFTTSAQFEDADAQSVEETMNQGLAENEMDITEENVLYDISDEDLASYTEIESLDEDFAEVEAGEEGDAQYADAGMEYEDEEIALTNADVLQNEEGNEMEIPGEAVFTNTMPITSLAEANLVKEQTRAQNKNVLMDIINNENVSEQAKQDAINSMIALTEVAQKECDAMVMLQAKGFSNNVVSIHGDYADVCIGMSELSPTQIAQIEDIVKRKTGIAAENITISPVGSN